MSLFCVKVFLNSNKIVQTWCSALRNMIKMMMTVISMIEAPSLGWNCLSVMESVPSPRLELALPSFQLISSPLLVTSLVSLTNQHSKFINGVKVEAHPHPTFKIKGLFGSLYLLPLQQSQWCQRRHLCFKIMHYPLKTKRFPVEIRPAQSKNNKQIIKFSVTPFPQHCVLVGEKIRPQNIVILMRTRNIFGFGDFVDDVNRSL